MPVFMVERQFADQLEAAPGAFDGINRVNDESGVRWLSSFLSADKRYINFMAGDDQSRIRSNYDRLAQVKKTYDPGNLFRVNQNIAPAG